MMFDCVNLVVIVVVIKDGCFVVVGGNVEIVLFVGCVMKVVDFDGCIVLLGLIDNYMYVICGGLNYNLELCWDGVWLFVVVMEMFKC